MAAIKVPDTPEMRYVRAYNACTNVLVKAGTKFDVIAHDATTQAVRDKARAASLEADRDLQLAKDRHEAWLAGTATILPPTAAQVANAQQLSTQLANVLAQEAQLDAIVGIATGAANALSAMHP